MFEFKKLAQASQDVLHALEAKKRVLKPQEKKAIRNEAEVIAQAMQQFQEDIRHRQEEINKILLPLQERHESIRQFQEDARRRQEEINKMLLPLQEQHESMRQFREQVENAMRPIRDLQDFIKQSSSPFGEKK